MTCECGLSPTCFLGNLWDHTSPFQGDILYTVITLVCNAIIFWCLISHLETVHIMDPPPRAIAPCSIPSCDQLPLVRMRDFISLYSIWIKSCIHLSSLKKILLRPIPFFFLMVLWHFFMHIYIPHSLYFNPTLVFCIRPPADGHLGSFQIWWLWLGLQRTQKCIHVFKFPLSYSLESHIWNYSITYDRF